jgi:hypothetical protein
MKAVVVYESLWGNTAAVAHAIAEGIGDEARAIPTDEASDLVLADADLVVAGAPVMAFRLPTEGLRQNLARDPGRAPRSPSVAHPSMRWWLDGLSTRHGRAAAFETKLRWSPSGVTRAIEGGLKRAGYTPICRAHHFLVAGAYGPLREGELERARAWGAELARAMA